MQRELLEIGDRMTLTDASAAGRRAVLALQDRLRSRLHPDDGAVSALSPTDAGIGSLGLERRVGPSHRPEALGHMRLSCVSRQSRNI